MAVFRFFLLVVAGAVFAFDVASATTRNEEFEEAMEALSNHRELPSKGGKKGGKKASKGGDDRLCQSHSACAKLSGFCCPTWDGKMLACCEDGPSKGKGKGKGYYTPSPSPSPSPSPYSKGKGKGKGGYSKGKGGYSKGSYFSQSPSCKGRYTSVQTWSLPLQEANGTIVNNIGEASNGRGQSWTFVDDLFDSNEGNKVGFSAEIRTRLNDGDKWHSEGTLMDLYGCKGYLAFEGPFSDFTSSGEYTITGGTGDFLYANGYITEEYQHSTRQSIRLVVVE